MTFLTFTDGNWDCAYDLSSGILYKYKKQQWADGSSYSELWMWRVGSEKASTPFVGEPADSFWTALQSSFGTTP